MSGINIEKIQLGITIALSLYEAGRQILEIIKDPNATEEDLMAVINEQNDAQALARQKLVDAIENAD